MGRIRDSKPAQPGAAPTKARGKEVGQKTLPVPHVIFYNLPPAPDPWAMWSAIGQVLSAILSFLALGFAFWTIWQNKKTLQLQMLESIMHDIRDLEFKFNQEYKDKPDEDKKLWDSAFFNTIEYFCFLVNNRMISDNRAIAFFRPAIIAWYEQMYAVNFNKEHVDDSGKLEEFKKLYSVLKGKEQTKAV